MFFQKKIQYQIVTIQLIFTNEIDNEFQIFVLHKLNIELKYKSIAFVKYFCIDSLMT